MDSLLDSFPSSSENLHLYTTSSRHPKIKECYLVLLKMYNSLTDPVVKLFIKNNCLHLMSLDKYTASSFAKEITPPASSFASQQSKAGRDFIDYVVDGPDKQGHPSLYTGK